MPSPPLAPLYTEPSLDMELLVFQRGYTPGRATLRTLRSYSANVEAGLDDRLRAESNARQTGDANEAQARTSADTTLGQRITDEASARSAADTAEAQARAAADAQEKADRQAADTAEATARANADTAEASTRAAADAGLQTQINALKAAIVPLTGPLVLPAGITLLVGKTARTVAVTGLRKNDNLVVTPNAALPANISMGEAYCLTDGTLTVVLLNTALLGLNITTAQTIPLGIIALRP